MSAGKAFGLVYFFLAFLIVLPPNHPAQTAAGGSEFIMAAVPTWPVTGLLPSQTVLSPVGKFPGQPLSDSM